VRRHRKDGQRDGGWEPLRQPKASTTLHRAAEPTSRFGSAPFFRETQVRSARNRSLFLVLHSETTGGLTIPHLAAFDAATGTLDPWNPRANTSTGPWAAAVTGNGKYVVVVGEFTTINTQRRPGYAQFAISG
jgi:hypothetical protein